MFPRVCDERGGNREGHSTEITLVRFLSGVSTFVIGQCAGLSECLTTDVTHIWFLPTVQSGEGGVVKKSKLNETTSTVNLTAQTSPYYVLVPDVYFVIGRGCKFEATALTGVGFLLAVVHTAVSHQLALLSKALVTVTATKRFLAC